ncbi:MAG TPA: hypothetical protein VKD08_14180 [Ignavibacteriaceae bacterium]|nr:hypothetical protein [Ignavibacteriaceae bacterium]
MQNKDYAGIINKYNPDYVVADYPVKPVYEKFTERKDFVNLYLSFGIASGELASVEIFSKT